MAYNLQSWQNTFANPTGNINRGIFTPQAMNAFRTAMSSPLGIGARTIFGIPAAVASTPFLAASGIDALTKRDPNATRSSLFNIDLTRNANEGVTLPGSTLNDWGSTMGDVPDGGVVPPTKKINTPLNTLDPNWQHQLRMQDIARGNIDNKGFSFPSIFGTVKGGLEWLGDKFKRPEAKQRAYEEIMKGGTYKGKPGYELYETPSGLKIGSDILGKGQGYAKNFDSMFGSQSIEEMEQKKLDWARERIRKGKAISKRLQTQLDLADAGDKITTQTTSGGAGIGPNVHGGGSEASFTRTSPGGISQATSRAARTDQSGNVMSGWRLAEGGRIGYRDGGDDEQDLNILEFMKDQGIEGGDMASAPHPDEAWLGLWENLSEKGIVPIEIETLNDFKNWFHNQNMDMGSINEQDQGIASLV